MIQRDSHNQPRLLIHVRTINNLGESRYNKPKSKEESHPCEVYSIQVIQRDSHNHSRLLIHVRRIYDVGEFYRYKTQKQKPHKSAVCSIWCFQLGILPFEFWRYAIHVYIKSYCQRLDKSCNCRTNNSWDRMVVGFTTTYAFCAYLHCCCEFESRSGRGIQHYVIKFVVC